MWGGVRNLIYTIMQNCIVGKYSGPTPVTLLYKQRHMVFFFLVKNCLIMHTSLPLLGDNIFVSNVGQIVDGDLNKTSNYQITCYSSRFIEVHLYTRCMHQGF